jgi:hypothetical protein
MIPGSSNPLMMAAAPAGALQISRSLRFNSSDSGYLSRVPSANSTSQTTFTWAGWIKQSSFNASGRRLFFYTGVSAGTGNIFGLEFNNDRLAVIFDGAGSYWPKTAAVFRDPSAWMHIVVAVDTTQATAANRCKFYVNGSQQTSIVDTQPPQNHAVVNGTTSAHRIASNPDATSFTFNGYLANIHFIDGQALTPSSFTETDATTGQLIPKTYTGTYGTNGFNLLFADNSSNTAATLGKDTSGNSNNWTPNNLSVTAGVGNDSLVDSPTNYGTDTYVGGEVRGNYATLNALIDSSSSTLLNGNLELTSSGQCYGLATIAPTSGKWYWELTVGTVVSNSFVGLYSNDNKGNVYLLYGFNGFGLTSYGFGSLTSTVSGTAAAGDVIGFAFNIDTLTITLYKNGSSLGTITGITLPSNWSMGMSANASISSPWIANFGQRAFAYTAPSGFKALCTQNLSEGTITTSGTYTGNGVADGPFVYLNGVPTAMTVGINAVTFGTHADKLSNGFKLRTTNVLYNQNALSYSYSITTTDAKFKYARAQPNP